MTVAQLAIPETSGSGLEPLPKGEERRKVPYEWSINGFGLNLASLMPMLEVPVLKTGPEALVMYADTLPIEGVGQWEKTGEVTNSTYRSWHYHSSGGCSTLKGTHRVEPTQSLPEGVKLEMG